MTVCHEALPRRPRVITETAGVAIFYYVSRTHEVCGLNEQEDCTEHDFGTPFPPGLVVGPPELTSRVQLAFVMSAVQMCGISYVSSSYVWYFVCQQFRSMVKSGSRLS